ncbi:unnamed protein product [Colias eurytheme]|nr:unnamed protein product [Colias eurytheme]
MEWEKRRECGLALCESHHCVRRRGCTAASCDRVGHRTSRFIRKPKTLGVFGGWAFGFGLVVVRSVCVCWCGVWRAVAGVWVIAGVS